MPDNPPNNSRKRDESLSKDGKWRSFPKVPNLLQYVSNGHYYGRIKVGGKIIRESLKTSVWTTAKLRLAEFLKTQQEAKAVVVAPTFNEAVELFKRELESDNTIKPRSKEYRLTCLKKIETSWPELWTLRLDNITPAACKEWASDLNSKIASHYFNNTIGTLRQVIDVGLKAHKANGGNVFENPAAELKRVRVKQKEMTLPEPSQFKDLVANVRANSGAWGQRVVIASTRGVHGIVARFIIPTLPCRNTGCMTLPALEAAKPNSLIWWIGRFFASKICRLIWNSRPFSAIRWTPIFTTGF